MKSYKCYSDGQYLKQADVDPPVVWTITNVKEQTVTAPGKPPKQKLVLYFDETQKGLVLNMTNCEVLAGISSSDDPEEWIGLRIELFVNEDVTYAGKRMGGVRLREVKEEPY
jgi:hypothetical protein